MNPGVDAPFRVSAVILAAGFSSRMGGRLKDLRPLAGVSFLERLIRVFQAAGVRRILVVCGPEAEEEAEARARALGALPLRRADSRRGMFGAIRHGLRAALEECPEYTAALLCPVDAALLRPVSVRALLRLHQAGADEILLPCFRGQAGHPALIPARHYGLILAWPDGSDGPDEAGGPDGLRGYYRGLLPGFPPVLPLRPGRGRANFLQGEAGNAGGAAGTSPVLFVPLPDAGVVSVLDTPEAAGEAEDFLRETEGRALPSLAEAWQLLCLSSLSARKMRHCILVGQGALRLALALPACREADFNPLLPAGAGLLHDVLRQEREHAVAGARLLQSLGWPDTSFVTGCHARLPGEYFRRVGIAYPDRKFRTMVPPPGAEAGSPRGDRLFYASVCVYLADKYARKDEMVSIAERFEDIRAWFRDDPGALEGLSERQEAVEELARWFSGLSGRDPRAVLGSPSGHPLDMELEGFRVIAK